MNSISQNKQSDIVKLGSNIRSLNWFLESFEQYATSMEPYIGQRVVVDQEKLRHVYFSWIQLFDSESVEQYSQENYWDCVDYIAGMGLTGLVVENPLSLSDESFVRRTTTPDALARAFGLNVSNTEDIPDIIEFWPEGFIYVCFCISFINRVRKQKNAMPTKLSSSSFQLKQFWWTFRENSMEDPNSILFFFDKILNNDPGSSVSNSLESRRHSGANTLQLKSENNTLKDLQENPDLAD